MTRHATSLIHLSLSSSHKQSVLYFSKCLCLTWNSYFTEQHLGRGDCICVISKEWLVKPWHCHCIVPLSQNNWEKTSIYQNNPVYNDNNDRHTVYWSGFTPIICYLRSSWRKVLNFNDYKMNLIYFNFNFRHLPMKGFFKLIF